MRPQFTRYPRWVIRCAVATVALTACSRDYSAPLASEPSIPSISVTFLPDHNFAFTVQGDSWTWGGVTVHRSGGYTGMVTLTIEGLPPKVSATFDPSSLDESQSESDVTFTAAADAPLVETYVTIRASGDGVADAKTVFRFAVAPPALD